LDVSAFGFFFSLLGLSWPLAMAISWICCGVSRIRRRREIGYSRLAPADKAYRVNTGNIHEPA
jgi:hypothetical protein